MTAVPTRVEWLDSGVTIASDDHPDEWIARDWTGRTLGPDALDEGSAWLVPAWDEDER